MSKNTEKKFVGQPIFKQIINLIEKVNISSIIKAHDSDQNKESFLSGGIFGKNTFDKYA